MCYMCEALRDSDSDQYEYCQDCGVAICFDAVSNSEWPEPAGVTAGGDLYCLRHAIKYDAAKEQGIEDDWYYEGQAGLPDDD